MKRTTPERIDVLLPGEIFVFGSNREGSHGGGAARTAHERFADTPTHVIKPAGW